MLGISYLATNQWQVGQRFVPSLGGDMLGSFQITTVNTPTMAGSRLNSCLAGCRIRWRLVRTWGRKSQQRSQDQRPG